MRRTFRDVSPVAFANRIARIGFLIAVFALLWARSAGAQTVVTYSFEDGTADSWTSFNGASTPVATTAAAYSGSYSLLTTTNSSGAGGPSISLNGVLQAGATYTITGYVMLTSGETATNANFTIKRTDPSCSGGTCYDTVGNYQVPVAASGWAQIGGSYTVSTTETGLVLYAQLVGATTAQSFYLDEVVITETAPPPGGTPIATYTFADGGLDGWTPFGSASLANSVPSIVDPNGDARSLLVTNRTAGYMGPSLNLLSVNNVVAGATYQITAYVLLAASDSSNPTATLSTKTTNCANTSGSYNNLATSGALSSTAWTKVQGTLSFSNLPGPPSSLVLYIQSSSATDSFYIDDVTIGQLSPAPPSPSQQDNSGITTTFEDGGLDGWSSRTGSSTLTNTTAEAHSGTHSLLVTGRVANYDGPQINVSDKMYVGSVYNASVWVMLLPTDGSNHILNMSLQTTLDGNPSYPSMTAYPGVTIPADGNWHQISVMRYNMANNYDPGAAYLYLQTVPASGNDLVSFYVDDFQLTYVPPPTIQTNIPSIFQTLAPFFRVGAEVDLTDLSGPHNQLLTKHFDSITSGNDMKWSSVEATLGTYTYENADSEVGMAVCNEMHIRGHNLVWSTGEQTPAYATGDGTNSAANQATVTANIQEHIQSEVQHFGTAVYAWDVVNEPIDPTQPDCLYHGPFYQVLGKGYIDVALQAARQYAPAGTELFINDYSTTDPDRLACLVRVIRDLRERGIPLDGLGHEMHNDINYPSADAVVHAVDTIHENFRDLDQQVTEMDVSVYNAGDNTSNYAPTVPPSLIAEQGWLYKQYFDALRRLRGKISAVTFWGFADDDTWLDSFPIDRLDAPLPFDTELQAKPAYWGIVDPTQLPGYGLSFSVSDSDDKGERHDTRVLTVTATNGDVGIAYATLINGFTLRQFAGERCSPVIMPPSGYPILLGDLAVGGAASAAFTVSFAGCGDFADFVLSVPWSSATYDTGTFVSVIHHRRHHGTF
ncbi:MAG TPA: endo-1,4-beta-xylanase [Candidatus Acidoferrum sp.]|nr:endo-1,4-beta-xylanase [Candidatus Acidoferrum sp.]